VMWKSVCPKWLAPKTMVNCGAIVVPFAFILIPQNRSMKLTHKQERMLWSSSSTIRYPLLS